MPDCVPPPSLATWTALLLYGAIALGVEAFILLFTLRPVRGGSWGVLALRGVLLVSALAVAVWSLVILANAQTMYQLYLVLFQGDDNHPPNTVACAMYATEPAFRQHMQAVIAPVEHTAAIASGASAVLLLVGVYLLARWMRRRSRVAPQTMAGLESDELQRERIV